MKAASTVISLAVILVVFGSIGVVGYLAATSEPPPAETTNTITEANERPEDITDPTRWREVYPDTKPMQLGTTTIHVSIADSLRERIAGLSNTPFLPENVAKLFVFRQAGEHSIWMKDMNYSLDILWLSEAGEIVHIAEDVAPETFPESFTSPTPAWYVLEADAGFVERHALTLGDTLALPETDEPSLLPRL